MKKTHLLRYILIFMVALIIFCSVLLLLTQKKPVDNSWEEKEYVYHVQVLIEKDMDTYWSAFREGAVTAAEEHDIFVEFIELESKETDNVVYQLRQGIMSNVDAIAFQPTDIEQCSQAVREANENNIQIITFENEEFILPDTPSIGADHFDIGEHISKLAMDVGGKNSKVAVLMDELEVSNNVMLCNEIKMQGIMESFSAFPDIEIQAYDTVNTNKFEMEKKIEALLQSYPSIDLIICTDAIITQSVAQYISEQGLDGEIDIVGYGSLSGMYSYIKQNIIYGLICADSNQIGYKVIEQLNELLNGNEVDLIQNVELYTINEENCDEYFQKR